MKDVRKSFSKSLIALSDGKVSVRYFSTPENRWATQSFDNDNGNSKTVFETLLSNSDELGITISPESGVVFDFMINEKSDSPEVYLYYPTSHNLTEREYEEFLKSQGGYSQAHEQFAKRFDGVDVEDDEAVLEVISELISERREDDGIIDFEGISRWGSLYPMARDFAEEFGFGLLDANPPSSDCEGFVTLSVTSGDGHRFWNFSEESKDVLLELISVAIAFDIECGFVDGEEILNITLYA